MVWNKHLQTSENLARQGRWCLSGLPLEALGGVGTEVSTQPAWGRRGERCGRVSGTFFGDGVSGLSRLVSWASKGSRQRREGGEKKKEERKKRFCLMHRNENIDPTTAPAQI